MFGQERRHRLDRHVPYDSFEGLFTDHLPTVRRHAPGRQRFAVRYDPMFAVFQTGGKQFRAEPGAVLQVPSLDAEPGTTVTFDDVRLASDGSDVTVGEPHVSGASVTAEVVAHDRSKKIIVFKRKRRKGYRRKQGHRQGYTVVRVADITL